MSNNFNDHHFQVSLLILEKCDNLEKLDRAAIEWKEKLKAEYLN